MAIRAAAPASGSPRPEKAQNTAASKVPMPPGSGNKKARRIATISKTRVVKLDGIAKNCSSSQISNIMPAHPSSERHKARKRERFWVWIVVCKRPVSSSQ